MTTAPSGEGSGVGKSSTQSTQSTRGAHRRLYRVGADGTVMERVAVEPTPITEQAAEEEAPDAWRDLDDLTPDLRPSHAPTDAPARFTSVATQRERVRIEVTRGAEYVAIEARRAKAIHEGVLTPRAGPALGHSLHLLVEARRQGWRDRALCAKSETWPTDDTVLERVERFYPRRKEPASKIADAKAVCAQCPVREECLEFALSVGEKNGVWGMTTGAERRVLRRKWVADQRKKLAEMGVKLGVEPGTRVGMPGNFSDATRRSWAEAEAELG